MENILKEIQSLRERIEKLEQRASVIPTTQNLRKKFDLLVQESCKALSVTQMDFYNAGKTRDVVLARHMVFYIATMHMGLAVTEVGRRVKKDHSTIIHGRNTFSDLLDTNKFGERDYYNSVMNALLQ